MLTFFPKPYPDELLYSIIARYHVWSGNAEMSDTMEQLFGNRRESATLFIPKHLKRLAEKTKEFGLNYETLLYKHTIFPLISCFLNKASFDNILFSVIDENQKENLLYINQRDIYPRFLRYCTHCMLDDRNEYGEAYWHRKHQSYGIEMCDKHRCRLKDSGIEVLDYSSKERFLALELQNFIFDTLEQEDISESRIEVQLANDIDYIYKNYEFISSIIRDKHSSIREATISLLYIRGLATKKGSVKSSKLIQEFQDRYANTKLKQMMKGLNSDENWLTKIYSKRQTRIAPIHFILFADYIAGSLESFMNIVNEQEQFIDRTKEVYQLPKRYEDKLVLYRKRCLDVWEKNPYANRKDLAKVGALTWMARHDKEWLIKNTPQFKKTNEGAYFKDWVKIDKELESKVEDAVYCIRNLVSKPERISRTNIGRYMGQKKMLAINYRFLPLTIRKIQQYVESTSDYQLRRIEWVKNELEKEGKHATPTIIFCKAGIRNEFRNKFRHLFTS